MQIILLFVTLFVAIVAVIFALQNTASVTVSFLFWHGQGSLALVLLLTLFAGVLIGFLAALPTVVKGQLTIRSHRKELTRLGTSLDEHKSQLEQARKAQPPGSAGPAGDPTATGGPSRPRDDESPR